MRILQSWISSPQWRRAVALSTFAAIVVLGLIAALQQLSG